MPRTMWVFAVGALVTMPVAAGADQTCWATLAGASGPPTAFAPVVPVSGPGKDLLIIKDVVPGRYEFDIRLMCSNPATSPTAPQALNAVDLDLFSQRNITVKAASINPGLIGGYAAGGAGPGRIAHMDGLALVAPLYGQFELGRIVVSITNAAGTPPGDWPIEARVGQFGWGENPFGAPYVQFGDSGSIWTYVPSASFGDIIVIRDIPEPATLALLGMGVLALNRRRR